MAADYQLSSTDVSEYEITHQHVSNTSGIHHIYIRQTNNGIPIYGATGGVHLDDIENVKAIDIQFISSVANRIKTKSKILSAFRDWN